LVDQKWCGTFKLATKWFKNSFTIIRFKVSNCYDFVHIRDQPNIHGSHNGIIIFKMLLMVSNVRVASLLGRENMQDWNMN
jgi:hypothetical protein